MCIYTHKYCSAIPEVRAKLLSHFDIKLRRISNDSDFPDITQNFMTPLIPHLVLLDYLLYIFFKGIYSNVTLWSRFSSVNGRDAEKLVKLQIRGETWPLDGSFERKTDSWMLVTSSLSVWIFLFQAEATIEQNTGLLWSRVLREARFVLV